MLSKRITRDIDSSNHIINEGGIPPSDQSKDIVRSFIESGTSFENAFDHTIAAGKEEGRKMLRNFSR